MARAASPLHLSLHANVGLLAQTSGFAWINAVEGFFAKLTKRRLKRDVFHSLVALQAAIKRFVAEVNANPRPFCWTKNPDKIIAAVRRAHQALDSHR